MQYDTTDKVLRDGFAVIRQYDPKLYARMARDNWRVATDFDKAFAGDSVMDSFMGWLNVLDSFATTRSRSDRRGGMPETYVSADDLRKWATGNDVPLALFTADILAHEYRHIHQPREGDGGANEPPAYRASIAFASKLPAPYSARLKALSEDRLAHY